MANAYTDTASTSLGGTVGGAGLVQKAYDRLLEFVLSQISAQQSKQSQVQL
jgi:hypothetical protein